MKKNASKAISLVLSAIMAMSTFAGLAGCKKVVDPAALKPVDLGGYEFILASHWASEYEPERGASDYGDALLDLIDEIQTEYNCKITVKSYPVKDTIASEVHTSIMAGDKPFDVLDLWTGAYTSLLSSNDLYDQKSIKKLDFTNGNFNTNVVTMGTWNEKVYGSWIGISNNVSGMFFNADMIAKKGLESPYDLYASDKWTFTKFKEMMKTLTEDTNGDGTPEVYGMVGNQQIEEALLFAGGGGYVSKTADGQFAFGLDTPKSMAAVEYIRSLYSEKLIHPEKDWLGVGQVFAEGGAAFIPYFVWANQWFSEMEAEYGFVPFPRADAEKDYIAYTDEPRMFVMPKTLTDPEKTGIIFNQLSRLAIPGKASFETSYKDLGFSDKAIEYFYKVAAVTKWNPANGVDTNEAKLALLYACQDPTAEPASKFAEIKDMMNTNIKDYYDKLPK